MNNKQIQEVIKTVQNQKREFIAPKRKMQMSIDNDTMYLVALSKFIEDAQGKLKEYVKSNKNYEASKIQLEIYEAVGKLQANQGLVNDKSLHYEKVWLPMYEKELEESKANFPGILNQCKEAISNLSDESKIEKESVKKIIAYISNEVNEFEKSINKKDEEFRNYTYKMLKRLFNKLQEEAQ
jgi:hypothetical protein